MSVTRFIDYAPMVFQPWPWRHTRDNHLVLVHLVKFKDGLSDRSNDSMPWSSWGQLDSNMLSLHRPRRIRASFGIFNEDYLRSVGPEQLLGNMAWSSALLLEDTGLWRQATIVDPCAYASRHHAVHINLLYACSMGTTSKTYVRRTCTHSYQQYYTLI